MIVWVTCGVVGVMLVILALYVWPTYRVWQKELAGKARLKEAEYTKQIMVEQAKAERDAAELQAAAIAIVGEAAQAYPEYQYQQFLTAFGTALENGDIKQVVYIPTEAGILLVEMRRPLPLE
ncbi:MAG: hypothetical protein GWN00_01485 [Aliifodinibius sp.]|nr:hypothetical protein [Phycisphaerae bacterium]NIR62352.1 hypothetical protein [candidate division Zixibacteria bacterium]NIT54951.1 hypothetical protein [Fodinibius sp.]NIW43363.1 hypothetical protein [Gammaproteobacteria bacterium]NIU12585.1 hypothetical protein [candidate division Zixibacteria bacterium]